MKPQDKSLEVFVDADFAGNWNINCTHDPSTAKSCTGYVITYAGCPLIWASKMQTEYALSTTESEYYALSTALREAIPLISLLKEIKGQGINVYTKAPAVHCKVFEDNSGALEIAKTPKMRPRTKHFNNKYHHFRDHVRKGTITIHAIKSEDQLADILTKMPRLDIFLKHHQSLMGW